MLQQMPYGLFMVHGAALLDQFRCCPAHGTEQPDLLLRQERRNLITGCVHSGQVKKPGMIAGSTNKKKISKIKLHTHYTQGITHNISCEKNWFLPIIDGVKTSRPIALDASLFFFQEEVIQDLNWQIES